MKVAWTQIRWLTQTVGASCQLNKKSTENTHRSLSPCNKSPGPYKTRECSHQRHQQLAGLKIGVSTFYRQPSGFTQGTLLDFQIDKDGPGSPWASKRVAILSTVYLDNMHKRIGEITTSITNHIIFVFPSINHSNNNTFFFSFLFSL
jgi:hypothetical protein